MVEEKVEMPGIIDNEFVGHNIRYKNSSLTDENNWNFLQIPSDHLVPQVNNILPSEAELESLEVIFFGNQN